MKNLRNWLVNYEPVRIKELPAIQRRISSANNDLFTPSYNEHKFNAVQSFKQVIYKMVMQFTFDKHLLTKLMLKSRFQNRNSNKIVKNLSERDQ